MSQEVEIMRRLSSGIILTPIEVPVDSEIRSFRLAARIDSLRKAGHEIETVPVHTGTGKTVVGYRFKWMVNNLPAPVVYAEPSGQMAFVIR